MSRGSTAFITLALLTSLGAISSEASAQQAQQPKHPAVERVMASADYRQAMASFDSGHDRIVEENLKLQQIPAPLRQEQRKAEAFAGMLRAQGLADVSIDPEGNVLAVRKGTGNGEMVAIVSHLDTVFDMDTDLTPKRDGTKINAPGIADNSRGLAAILAMTRAMDAAGIKHRHDILIVGSVGEEGLGDLRGVKYLLRQGQYKDQIKTFITFDGLYPDQVMNTAAGSKRYEVRYKGPGGHSYRAFGTVNPMYPLGAAMQGLAGIEVPKGTTHSVGVIGGGTSVNSIPTEAWMLVDMRSASPEDLGALEKRFLDIVSKAAEAENATRSTKSGSITAVTELVGDRPSGKTSEDQPIVGVAVAAVAAHGWTPKLVSASTDANVPISMGIPTVTIASGIGDRQHSLDEFLDVEKSGSVRQLGMALTTLLALADMTE
ncbi:acetylornithine deacetylase/succinyl-diaminopimelate desuccinylase-like protein [Skermanella aerolata]|uniref:M20/M25/M40 family metallo-hydrolase n=1 Tax=Skermanella aerolata TaxID=393310 RepID=UPI003D263526